MNRIARNLQDGSGSLPPLQGGWGGPKGLGIIHEGGPTPIDEFGDSHNDRQRHTNQQMMKLVQGMDGVRLTFPNLIADNGLESGARGEQKSAA